MVAEAHEEAKAALKEIRDLVRGIHPVILEDRGLDAALSAVVARSPVPVDARRATSTQRPPAGGRERGLLRRHRGARPTSPATRRPPGPRVASPGPATGSCSRSATTASAAPTPRRRAPALARACATGSPALGGTMYVISPDGRPDHDLGGAAVRIVIAEDSVLLRAGLDPDPASTPARRSSPRSATPTSCSRAVERHQPDLAVVDVRMPPTHTDDGLRAALADPRAVAADRHPRAVAVRRGALRHRAARRRHAGDRLPAEGPHRRRRRVPRRRAAGRRRRHRARPRGRRPAARPSPPHGPARAADAARARGAGADGRGPHQPGHRPCARRSATRRSRSTSATSSRSSTCRRPTTTTAGCWPSCSG